MTLRLAGRCITLVLALLAAPALAAESGQPAPTFAASALVGGGPLRLEDYRGKVVYLDFWASWCAPCRQSLPWMETMRVEFAGAGFEVLAVNVDASPAAGVRFLQRFPVSYPVVGDSAGTIAALYDVQYMPSSYLIDRRGVVRQVHRGFDPQAGKQLRAEIAALLKEQP